MKSARKRPTALPFCSPSSARTRPIALAARIKDWIAPRHAGILRIIARSPACNQRTLAKRLGVLPSRMVILLDELTEKGLIERRRSTTDRRHSEIVLTRRGQRMLEKLSRLAAEHEADLCAALTAKEREQLAALGRKIVHQQGLIPDVHPGYRKL
jgi:DNA-binding MarR family transcriptional regulator